MLIIALIDSSAWQASGYAKARQTLYCREPENNMKRSAAEVIWVAEDAMPLESAEILQSHGFFVRVNWVGVGKDSPGNEVSRCKLSCKKISVLS